MCACVCVCVCICSVCLTGGLSAGASLFGNTQSKGFGFSSALGTSGGLGGAGLGFGGFGGIQPTQNQPGESEST